jgi:hypothetical protein
MSALRGKTLGETGMKFAEHWTLHFEVRWFDLWVGFFIDTKKNKVYFCPWPMLVLVFSYIGPTLEQST